MVDVLSKLTSQSEKEEAERARKLLTSLRGTVSKPVEGKKALLLHFSMRLEKDWETEEPERKYKSDSDEDEEESKEDWGLFELQRCVLHHHKTVGFE